MKRYLTLELFLAIFCVLLVAALWAHPYVLTGAIAAVGGLFIWRSSHAYPVVLYVSAGIGGSIAEMVAMHFGAWSYADPQILSIPLWLPFLWGNAALFIVALSRIFNE